VFEEKTLLLQRVVRKCGLVPWVVPSTFPTYESLVEQFKRAGRKSLGVFPTSPYCLIGNQ